MQHWQVYGKGLYVVGYVAGLNLFLHDEVWCVWAMKVMIVVLCVLLTAEWLVRTDPLAMVSQCWLHYPTGLVFPCGSPSPTHLIVDKYWVCSADWVLCCGGQLIDTCACCAHVYDWHYKQCSKPTASYCQVGPCSLGAQVMGEKVI